MVTDKGCINRDEFASFADESRRHRENTDRDIKNIYQLLSETKGDIGEMKAEIAGVHSTVSNFFKIFEVVNNDINGKGGLNHRFLEGKHEAFTRIEVIENKQKTHGGMLWAVMLTIITIAIGILFSTNSSLSQTENKQQTSSN